MKKPCIKLLPLEQCSMTKYLSLRVAEYQSAWIESPEVSLVHRNTNAWNISWTILCITAEDTMVGYAMHGRNGRGDVWLDRLMIDERFQGCGYGTAALRELLSAFETIYPESDRILLSVNADNQTAIELYRRFGFTMTDQLDGEDPIMCRRNSGFSNNS